LEANNTGICNKQEQQTYYVRRVREKALATNSSHVRQHIVVVVGSVVDPVIDENNLTSLQLLRRFVLLLRTHGSEAFLNQVAPVLPRGHPLFLRRHEGRQIHLIGPPAVHTVGQQHIVTQDGQTGGGRGQGGRALPDLHHFARDRSEQVSSVAALPDEVCSLDGLFT
jgi:hypothetical protein